jgi:hypothetical protein
MRVMHIRPRSERTLFSVLITLLLLLALMGCAGTGGFRADAENRPWKFAYINDTRGDNTNTPGKSGINDVVVRMMAVDIVKEGASLVITGGDAVNGFFGNGGTGYGAQFANWRTAMAPVYNAGIPVYPVRGNHEFGPLEKRLPWPPVYPAPAVRPVPELLDAYRAAFRDSYIPKNGPPGEEGLTYSFSHKNAFFVALDQYGDHPQRVNQGWLTGEFSRNRLPHVFVYGHEPAFRVLHSDCLAYYPVERDRFWDSIGDAGGRVYFAGHDHLYNRALITDSKGREIRQVIAGTGGAPLAKWPGEYAEGSRVKKEFADSDHYGYVIVTIEGPKAAIDWKAIVKDGSAMKWKVLDSFSYTVSPTASDR